jgi:hypothetical protein
MPKKYVNILGIIEIMQINKHKPEIIRVSLSTPFLVRSRCKGCGGHPNIYYWIRNPSISLDPRKGISEHLEAVIRYMSRYSTRVISDFYLEEKPSSFTKINLFNYNFGPKSFNPRAHKNRGTNMTFEVVEYLTCECGKSAWAFTDKIIKNKPEIFNRKSRFTFPNKFDF